MAWPEALHQALKPVFPPSFQMYQYGLRVRCSILIFVSFSSSLFLLSGSILVITSDLKA